MFILQWLTNASFLGKQRAVSLSYSCGSCLPEDSEQAHVCTQGPPAQLFPVPQK